MFPSQIHGLCTLGRNTPIFQVHLDLPQGASPWRVKTRPPQPRNQRWKRGQYAFLKMSFWKRILGPVFRPQSYSPQRR